MDCGIRLQGFRASSGKRILKNPEPLDPKP